MPDVALIQFSSNDNSYYTDGDYLQTYYLMKFIQEILKIVFSHLESSTK